MDGSCSSSWTMSPTMPGDSLRLKPEGGCLDPAPGAAVYNSTPSSVDPPKDQGEEPGFCMMCTMEKHIIQVFANPGDVIQPVGVLCELQNIAEHFNHGSQEDAHEFLRYTVDAMQQSCLLGNIFDRQTQATTFIHQVFGGHPRSRIECLNCKEVSDTFAPFLDITLEIKTTSSVSNALKQFVRPEQLDGENSYKCANCNKMVTASKRLTVHRSSNVLTLSLKRFDIFSGGKITKDVKYPEYLDLRPFMSQSQGEPQIYELYAVLVHSGSSCHAGHYFCYVKASSGQWYKMNDSSVTVSDIKSVLSQHAYVLFYIKSTDVKEASDHSHMSQYPPQTSDPSAGAERQHQVKPSSRVNAGQPSRYRKGDRQYSDWSKDKERHYRDRSHERETDSDRYRYRMDHHRSYRGHLPPHDRPYRDWEPERRWEHVPHHPRGLDREKCSNYYHHQRSREDSGHEQRRYAYPHCMESPSRGRWQQESRGSLPMKDKSNGREKDFYLSKVKTSSPATKPDTCTKSKASPPRPRSSMFGSAPNRMDQNRKRSAVHLSKERDGSSEAHCSKKHRVIG